MALIDDWVKNNDVVIFMKGTRDMPRCGFSNFVVQILNFYNIKNVKVVNILENQTVREAFEDYRSDENRIKEIENKIKNGEMITTEDILWVCQVAKHGIWAQEASWYDHG